MGALAVGFAYAGLGGDPSRRVSARVGVGCAVLQVGALSLAGLMVAGLVFVQVPALSGRWVNAEVFGSQRNLVSRVYLWQGAQQMLAARPVLGFGPSGYRVWAVDYLNPDAHDVGADLYGNTDPTVYSAQSPHSADLGDRHSAGRAGVDRVRRAARGVGCACWCRSCGHATRRRGCARRSRPRSSRRCSRCWSIRRSSRSACSRRWRPGSPSAP